MNCSRNKYLLNKKKALWSPDKTLEENARIMGIDYFQARNFSRTHKLRFKQEDHGLIGGAC